MIMEFLLQTTKMSTPYFLGELNWICGVWRRQIKLGNVFPDAVGFLFLTLNRRYMFWNCFLKKVDGLKQSHGIWHHVYLRWMTSALWRRNQSFAWRYSNLIHGWISKWWSQFRGWKVGTDSDFGVDLGAWMTIQRRRFLPFALYRFSSQVWRYCHLTFHTGLSRCLFLLPRFWFPRCQLCGESRAG